MLTSADECGAAGLQARALRDAAMQPFLPLWKDADRLLATRQVPRQKKGGGAP
jgi:hypothetical protein